MNTKISNPQSSLVPTGPEYWKDIADQYAAAGRGLAEVWEYIAAALMMRSNRTNSTELQDALFVKLDQAILRGFVANLPRLGYDNTREELKVIATEVLPRLDDSCRRLLLQSLNALAAESRYRSVVVQTILDWSDIETGIFPSALTWQTLNTIVLGIRYNRKLRHQALRQMLAQQDHWEYKITLERLQGYCAILGATPLECTSYIGRVAPGEWQLFFDRLVEVRQYHRKADGNCTSWIYEHLKHIIVAEPRDGMYGVQRLLGVYDDCSDVVQALMRDAAEDTIENAYADEGSVVWIGEGEGLRDMPFDEYVLLQKLAASDL